MKGYASSMPLFDHREEMERQSMQIEPVDPHVLESDVPRLKGASRRVLDRLKQGPATNLQLMQPDCGGARFGGRLNDLKAVGVIWTKQHIKRSVWEYRLIQCPEELA